MSESSTTVTEDPTKMFEPILLLVLDRCAPDGLPILADAAPPPVAGAVYHEIKLVAERAPDDPIGYRVVSRTDTGRRFIYIDRISPELHDDDPKLQAETAEMHVVINPCDFTMHRLRPA